MFLIELQNKIRKFLSKKKNKLFTLNFINKFSFHLIHKDLFRLNNKNNF